MIWSQLLQAGLTAAGIGGSLAAGDKVAKGADAAALVQQNIYNQNRADLAPYRAVGTSALNAYAQAMGLPQAPVAGETYDYPQSGPASPYDVVRAFQQFKGRAPTAKERKYYSDRERADQLYWDVVKPGMDRLPAEIPTEGEDRYGGFEASPGYEWRLEQGNRAIDRGAAAQGRYMSGARLKAASRFNQDYASNEFGNYMNRLAGAAGIGQTAVGQGIGAGNVYSTNAGNAMQNAANARASGYLGATNTLMRGVDNWMAVNPFRAAGNQPGQTGYTDYLPGYS